MQLHCRGPTGKVSRIRAVFGVCMGLILVPRLGTAVMIRKIDRLSSRRAYFETRRQEANAPSMEHVLVDKSVLFLDPGTLEAFFLTLSSKG